MYKTPAQSRESGYRILYFKNALQLYEAGLSSFLHYKWANHYPQIKILESHTRPQKIESRFEPNHFGFEVS